MERGVSKCIGDVCSWGKLQQLLQTVGLAKLSRPVQRGLPILNFTLQKFRCNSSHDGCLESSRPRLGLKMRKTVIFRLPSVKKKDIERKAQES